MNSKYLATAIVLVLLLILIPVILFTAAKIYVIVSGACIALVAGVVIWKLSGKKATVKPGSKSLF